MADVIVLKIMTYKEEGFAKRNKFGVNVGRKMFLLPLGDALRHWRTGNFKQFYAKLPRFIHI